MSHNDIRLGQRKRIREEGSFTSTPWYRTKKLDPHLVGANYSWSRSVYFYARIWMQESTPPCWDYLFLTHTTGSGPPYVWERRSHIRIRQWGWHFSFGHNITITSNRKVERKDYWEPITDMYIPAHTKGYFLKKAYITQVLQRWQVEKIQGKIATIFQAKMHTSTARIWFFIIKWSIIH